MGQSILKGKRDVDLYCIWSSNVDQPILIGTAQEVIEHQAEHRFEMGSCRAIDPERTRENIARADETGSGTKHAFYGRWDGGDDYLVVAQYGTLPRVKLYDFLVILHSSESWFDTGELPAEAMAMIEPFEDDDG